MATLFRSPLFVARSRRVDQAIQEAARRLPNLLLSTLLRPFAQLDWPNPAVRGELPQLLEALNLLGTTLEPAPAASPFYQLDWPNPSVTRNRGLFQVTDSFSIPLPLGAIPFSLMDWQNPPPSARRGRLQSSPELNLLATTLAPSPAGVDDWTVTHMRRRGR